MSDRKGMDAVYALGAYEVMQYIRDIAEKLDDADGLKALIRDEYKLARRKLYDIIMKGEEAEE